MVKDFLVLGVDIIVILNGEVLEKLCDVEYVAQMLCKLLGQIYQVMIVVVLVDSQYIFDCLVVIDVIFRMLIDEDIVGYVVSDELLDKVGVYGIQGLGGCFVRKINGSYYVVVGLLLVEMYELLSNFNVLCEKRDKYDG